MYYDQFICISHIMSFMEINFFFILLWVLTINSKQTGLLLTSHHKSYTTRYGWKIMDKFIGSIHMNMPVLANQGRHMYTQYVHGM